MFRIGVDTGRTFTDLVLLRPSGVAVHKVRSTPNDPSQAILNGIEEARRAAGLEDARKLDVVHGSTVATNAGRAIRHAAPAIREHGDGRVVTIAAAALIFIYVSVRIPVAMLLLVPFVAFFATGYFGGFGAVTAELYPTAIRAAAQGFTYNIGRIASAVAPFVVGSVAQTQGFRVALSTTSIAFLLAALTWIWIPETRGRRLT